MKESGLDRLRGFFDPLDWHFARFMAGLDGNNGGEVFLAALLASHRTGLGDICLNIPAAGGRGIEELVEMERPGPKLPGADEWMRELRKSPVVCGADGKAPLVLDGRGRLYLYRYFLYERQLAEDIRSRYERLCGHINRDLLDDGIKRLFGQTGAEIDPQALAVMNAVLRPFCVISGGPGTGKTSTVVKVMALTAEQLLDRGISPRIAMTAPTGKASMRLQQAAGKALESLPCADVVKEHLPREAATMHRLLGSRPGSPYFLHGRDNPLPHDLLLVDESSMADLPLLAKFFQAVRPEARVIMLGDRDQLASVEAGAAFGDICAGAPVPSAPDKKEPSAAGSIVILKKSYRFGPGSGIGRLAAAVREGDYPAAAEILAGKTFADVTWEKPPGAGALRHALEETVTDAFGGYMSSAGPGEALDQMEKFMILSPLRGGPWGVLNLNGIVETILKKHYFIDGADKWYHRRPVMINVNDYATGLYNGDTGVVFHEGAPAPPRVFFKGAEGAMRSLVPSRLPSHETCFALTVHKSQGSEYDRVFIILPDRYSPVLTRELLYTAVTRAKTSVRIWAGEAVLKKTVETGTRRSSGLRDLLWNDPGGFG